MSEVWNDDEFIKDLGWARKINERYVEAFGEPITEPIFKLAFTRHKSRTTATKAAPANFPQADNSPGTCAKCNGPIWDNRADKAAGKVSAKYPDWKCKDQDCGWVAWQDSKKPKRKPAPEPDLPEPGPDDGLPF